MSDKLEDRGRRLGRLRAWARGPYQNVEVSAPQQGKKTIKTGAGIARLPAQELGISQELPGVPGSPTTFHNACDAPPGTTTSEGGGPFLNQPVVLCAFWGAIWNTSISPSLGAIYAAVTSLSTPVTNQYGTYSYFDGLGEGWSFDFAQPPIVITSSTVTIPAVFAQSDIENAARAIVNTFGPHLSWDLLIIFLPPGLSTPGITGEHSFYQDAGDPSINYTWIGYSPQLANMTFIFSHEMVEAMTDPHGDALQVNPRNPTNWHEICDVCCSAGSYNGVVVSAYFSQALGACMIPTPPVAAFPAGDYQIDSVHKVYDTERGPSGGRLQYIESVSGPGHGNGRWTLLEADVVDIIKSGQATFYTSIGGRRAAVEVESWYLKTVADAFTPNNLDALPEF
jgi:hypothetical protein